MFIGFDLDLVVGWFVGGWFIGDSLMVLFWCVNFFEFDFVEFDLVKWLLLKLVVLDWKLFLFFGLVKFFVGIIKLKFLLFVFKGLDELLELGSVIDVELFLSVIVLFL